METRPEKPQTPMSDLEAGIIWAVALGAVGVVYGLEAVHKLKDSLVTGAESATKGVARLWRNMPLKWKE